MNAGVSFHDVNVQEVKAEAVIFSNFTTFKFQWGGNEVILFLDSEEELKTLIQTLANPEIERDTTF